MDTATFDASTYAARRAALRQAVDGGAILLLGNGYAPRNYTANAYPFRQDSHFLYYVGAAIPDLAMLLLPDGEEILYGPPEHPDDLIWSGPHPTLSDHANAAGVSQGVSHTADIATLGDRVTDLQRAGIFVHTLPAYRGDRTLALARLLKTPPNEIEPSEALVRAIVTARSRKSAEEIAQIENALRVTAEMYAAAMRSAAPGVRESEVAAAMQAVAIAHDRAQSFAPIVSVRGEVLHNESYKNTMQAGQLLVIDSGVESPLYYASDITRTIPVSGRYSPEQRAVYEVVLRGQLAAIEAASPTRTNHELHLLAARTIAEGLRELGLMRGNVDDAVAAGAHALFFVHGLGHMMGLDVHDMEDLGDAVGYADDQQRSEQFGLSFLRLARRLEPGFVLTIEPGVYFVPALIDRWRAEKRHAEFIDYDAVERFRHFGGIRIEDDILITEDGCRVLGPGIPKTVDEVEAAMAS